MRSGYETEEQAARAYDTAAIKCALSAMCADACTVVLTQHHPTQILGRLRDAQLPGTCPPCHGMACHVISAHPPAMSSTAQVEDYAAEMDDIARLTTAELIAHLRRKSSGFSRGASKFRGVTRHHQHGRWEARIGRVMGNKCVRDLRMHASSLDATLSAC